LLTERAADLVELGLSGPTLRNYINAWDVWNKLPEATRSNLDLTDLYKLAVVKDEGKRNEIAQEAVTGDWKVKDVEKAATTWQKSQQAGNKRGPKERPAVVKQIGQLQKAATLCLTLDDESWIISAAHRSLVLQDLDKLQLLITTARAKLVTSASA
jgi:hypothetical protein